jgi:hypothetical protein
MCGTTRTSVRYWAEGPDYENIYYKCLFDLASPRHAAAYPDHPRAVTVREDTLMQLIGGGLAERVFGPDRRALLETQIPASAAQAAEQHQRQRDRLSKELAHVDLAQRSQITLIDILDPDPANTAAQAMRARCYERFAELQAERETAQAQLATSTTPPPATTTPASSTWCPCSPAASTCSPSASRPPSTRHSTSKPSTSPTCTR